MSHLGQFGLVWFLVAVVWFCCFIVAGLDYGCNPRGTNRFVLGMTVLAVAIGVAVCVGIVTTNAVW